MVTLAACLRLPEPRLERRYYAFPCVATYGGPGGHGFRVLPFYGTREVAGEERSSYVLWPFHIRAERLVPGYGWERRRLDLPFFAAIDGAGRRVRSYGLLAYTHAVDERKGTESIGAPWPFVFRQRRLGEREWQVWRAFPFYARSDVRGISSRVYAWPAYRRKSEDVDDYHYERRRVLEFLWRRQTLVNETSGHPETLVTMVPWLRSERDARPAFVPADRQRVVVQLVRVGTDTLSIGALLSLFVGMVMVVQAADQVREVSQDILGPIVGLAMTKELGPVLMAFLLAGRAGSAMAAELGSMTVYDEINALRTMDIDPVRFLVMPRFVAATVALPVLILYSDFIGVWGGAAVVAADPAITIPVSSYFARMLEWVHFTDFVVGLVKGVVFGMVASILPCTFGLRTRGGTEGIAASTTAAVVWSFILILVFDFLIVRVTFALD